MALFKDIEEISQYLPVAGTFDFKNVLPKIRQVERDIIKPILSPELYEELESKYQDDTLTDIQSKLLDAVREPVVNIAFQLFIPQGSIQITSSGFQIASTESLKTAFDWQLRNLSKSFLETGYSALDNLIEFLESNAEQFTAYKNSEERKKLKSLFIYTSSIFNEYFEIPVTRYTLLRLLPIMNRIENDAIKPNISDELFNELKQQIQDSTITDDNKKLLDYIRKVITQLTIEKAVNTLSLEITDTGITYNNYASFSQIERKTPATESQLTRLQIKCEKDGNNYLKQLQDYLYENADTYPLFKASTAYKPNSPSYFTNDPESNIYAAL
jgi:hypothetical protein